MEESHIPKELRQGAKDLSEAGGWLDGIGSVFNFLFQAILWGVPLMLGGGFLINQFRDQLPDFITSGFDGFLTVLGNFMPFLKDIPMIGDAIKDSTARTGANMTPEQGSAALNTFAPTMSAEAKAVLAPHVGKMLELGLTTPESLSKPENITMLLGTNKGRALARDLLPLMKTDGTAAADPMMVEFATKFRAGLSKTLSDPAAFGKIWADAEQRKLLLDGASTFSGTGLTTATLEKFFGHTTTEVITKADGTKETVTVKGTSGLGAKEIGPIMASFVSEPEKTAAALLANPKIPAEAVAELTKAQAAGPSIASTPAASSTASEPTTTTATLTSMPALTAEQVTAFRSMPEPVRAIVKKDPVGAIATWATAADKPLTAKDLVSIAPMVANDLPEFVNVSSEPKAAAFIKLVTDMGSENFQKFGNGVKHLIAEDIDMSKPQGQGALLTVLSTISPESRTPLYAYLATIEGAPTIPAAVKTMPQEQLRQLGEFMSKTDLSQEHLDQLMAAAAALKDGKSENIIRLFMTDEFRDSLATGETKEEQAKSYKDAIEGLREMAAGMAGNNPAVQQLLKAPKEGESSMLYGFATLAGIIDQYSGSSILHNPESALRDTALSRETKIEDDADIQRTRMLSFVFALASGQKLEITKEAMFASDHVFKVGNVTASAKELSEFFKSHQGALEMVINPEFATHVDGFIANNPTFAINMVDDLPKDSPVLEALRLRYGLYQVEVMKEIGLPANTPVDQLNAGQKAAYDAILAEHHGKFGLMDILSDDNGIGQLLQSYAKGNAATKGDTSFFADDSIKGNEDAVAVLLEAMKAGATVESVRAKDLELRNIAIGNIKPEPTPMSDAALGASGLLPYAMGGM